MAEGRELEAALREAEHELDVAGVRVRAANDELVEAEREFGRWARRIDELLDALANPLRQKDDEE